MYSGLCGTVLTRYTNMGKQKQKTKTERTSPIQQARSELERDCVPKKKVLPSEPELGSENVSHTRSRVQKSDLP